MAFEMAPDVLFAAVTALLLTAFAVAVGWIGRFRGAPLWFMLFEGGFGLTAALSNFQEGFTSRDAQWHELPTWTVYAFDFPVLLTTGIGAVGLLLLAQRFPTPLSEVEGRGRWVMLVPLGLAAGFVVWNVTDWLRASPDAGIVNVIGLVVSTSAFESLRAMMWATVLMLAVRYGRTADARARSQIALMAAAVAIYSGMYGVWLGMRYVFDPPLPSLAAYFWVAIVMVAASALAWLRCTRGPGAAAARNVVLVILASTLVGMIVFATAPQFSPSGFARILAILVLAFAVLRHQILGIDVKVRFAISKSTIAAIFIAVFFIASEAAQQFFGDRFSNQRYGSYMGIAAAGTLVFALAPMQRLADRIAEKAVPKSGPEPLAIPAAAWVATSTAASMAEREESFRRATRLAWRDRVLTRGEERDLLELAHHLGISPLRAGAIQDELQSNAGGKARRRR